MQYFEEKSDAANRWFALSMFVLFSALFSMGSLAGNNFSSFNAILTLTAEDQWLESLQAFGYFVGAALSAYGFIRSPEKLFFGAWLILCVFFWGEETSWGQRIFNYEVESVQALSLQNEFNIHNLHFLNFGGLTAAEDWKGLLMAFLDIQFVFQGCFFLYFAVIPFVCGFSATVRSLVSKLGYIMPSRSLVMTFLALFVLSYAAVLSVDAELYKNALVEVRETLFAIVVPVYLLQSFWKVRKARLA